MSHYVFETSGFRDDEAARARRVNEGVGGFALAEWLAGQLRARGFQASAPWEEDHGCDFDIALDGQRLLCACCIEEDGGDARTGHVSLDRLKTVGERLRGLFGHADAPAEARLKPVLAEILGGCPDINNLQSE